MILETVRKFAERAHGEQTRKYTPEQYMVHPIRVMELCQLHTDDNTILAAALLHDVLEDTNVTREEIKDMLNTVMDSRETAQTIGMVIELTDIFTKEHYPDMNRSARKAKELERLELISEGAQTIKYADIIDNCREIAVHDRNFAPKFLKECKQILAKLDKGNTVLYREAQMTVQNGFEALKR